MNETNNRDSIMRMARGAFEERVDYEMDKVIQNILDPNTKATANVIEEIADVQIMLDQLRLIFARNTDEVEEDKLRRLLGRLNSYAESNLHEWLNKARGSTVWNRTAVDTGAQPREGGAPDE